MSISSEPSKAAQTPAHAWRQIRRSNPPRLLAASRKKCRRPLKTRALCVLLPVIAMGCQTPLIVATRPETSHTDEPDKNHGEQHQHPVLHVHTIDRMHHVCYEIMHCRGASSVRFQAIRPFLPVTTLDHKSPPGSFASTDRCIAGGIVQSSRFTENQKVSTTVPLQTDG